MTRPRELAIVEFLMHHHHMKLPVIFIGEAPSRSAFGPEAFNAPSGLYLAALSGLTLPDLLARCVTVNLLPENPGKAASGKGDAWPAAQARAMWPRCLAEISRLVERDIGRVRATAPDSRPSTAAQQPLRLVFCGRRALTAARLPSLPWASWSTWGALAGRWVEATCIPHPSGVNRAYNDPALKAQISAFLKDLLTIAAGGATLAKP